MSDKSKGEDDRRGPERGETEVDSANATRDDKRAFGQSIIKVQEKKNAKREIELLTTEEVFSRTWGSTRPVRRGLPHFPTKRVEREIRPSPGRTGEWSCARFRTYQEKFRETAHVEVTAPSLRETLGPARVACFLSVESGIFLDFILSAGE